MLRQKCDAWREEVEKLAPLRDEVGRLHAHIGGLEEQIRSLQTNNESLGKQLQSVVEESERKQMETYRKAPPDYDNIRTQLAELQEVRVQLENELVRLREERARILAENAHLRESTQPEKYANLKENYEVLDVNCRQLEKALEDEKALVQRLTDTNRRMEVQLSEATNPDQLQTIRTRMERYRQERDTASKQVEELQQQLEMHKAELYRATEASESHVNQIQEQLAQYQQDASTLASKAQDYELRMRRYREERNQAQSANKGLQEQINTLKTTVQNLNSQLQTQHQVAASLTSMESGVFETGDYSPQQPLYNRESPISPTDEDQTTSPTLEQYSPYKYTTSDDQYREDVVPKAERTRKTQQGDNRHLGGGHRSHSSSSASLASSGGENRKPKSRSRSSGGYQLTNVRTKDGQMTTYIQKPPMPLNLKEKPRVIIKRGEGDFETGTLMYIGTINQKEMAGIQLDIRMPSKCSRCLLM